MTLDTSALIAAERGDRRFWAAWALLLGNNRTLPATVLAQAWRGPRSARLARVIDACEVEPLDERRARQVGLLLAASRSADIVDASVVVGAAQRGDDILTGDPDDIRRLAALAPGVGKILDLTRLGL